jgi:ABC-2 type transport system permease protein
VSDLLRPYRAAFVSRFLQMLQYRTAALAGFATQCWWGGIKVMVLAAFYANGGSGMPLADAITYTWIAQGLLALVPWSGDPEVAQAVRTGSVAYDRLRPVDAYGLWFARAAGWIAARVLPRLVLMAGFAIVALPLAGFDAGAWQPPAHVAAGVATALSLLLALALSAACVMLLNIATAAMLNDRGINAIAVPVLLVCSGNVLPLSLLPDAWQAALVLQPFAGLVDIPVRLYTGRLVGAEALGALALQLVWIAVFVAAGHAAMRSAMRRLDVQGG